MTEKLSWWEQLLTALAPERHTYRVVLRQEARIVDLEVVLGATLRHLKRYHDDPLCPVIQDAEAVLAGRRPMDLTVEE